MDSVAPPFTFALFEPQENKMNTLVILSSANKQPDFLLLSVQSPPVGQLEESSFEAPPY